MTPCLSKEIWGERLVHKYELFNKVFRERSKCKYTRQWYRTLPSLYKLLISVQPPMSLNIFYCDTSPMSGDKKSSYSTSPATTHLCIFWSQIICDSSASRPAWVREGDQVFIMTLWIMSWGDGYFPMTYM